MCGKQSGENVFDDKPGSWAPVSWDEVVTRNPDVIVIVDASWSPASQKARALGVERHANIEAVKHQRMITLDFSYTAPGARTAAAVRKLAEALYPEKFAAAHIARTAQDPAGVK